MLKYSKESNNELIRKRRKKKRIKRNILLLLMMSSITVTLGLKLSYFNITNIIVKNNKNVTIDEIKKLSGVNVGNNIFYINLKKSKTNILSNPYILGVEVKRKLPNAINISVQEREAIFYNVRNNKYLIIDTNGIVLEEKNDINNMKLIKMEGFDFQNSKLGKSIDEKNNRKIKALKTIGELLFRNNSEFSPSSIDLGNVMDIKIYYGDICVKLGDEDNLEKKINTAVNILRQGEMKNAKKGYIDVSFNGNPVFFIEN